jgi:hypothetical protein
MKVKVD